MTENNENPDDIFKILITSDLHLGYNESDTEARDDSFNTFEEILQYALEYEVDFILLGGDLFHDAKPSPSCLLRCTSLLRKYCFGDKPVNIEILSEQSENFKESMSKSVNYEDPNINIAYPIFSIHGNHDDPIGHSAISSLDILSRMGLVNYIGKWTNYNEVTVSPVLMKKGETKIALYGLSYLKDQRLARLFADQKVKIEKVCDDDWFNILTLHQNRADRGFKNYIPEEVLPDFMDLIVWGHEHDCRITPEWNGAKEFHVIQPGSPVATSLALGESLPKHCGILHVYKKGFKMIPLKLQTVRPFIFDVIVLSEQNLTSRAVNEHEIVQDFLKKRVEEALEKAKNEVSGHPKQPSLPLIRLKVLFERESQQFNIIRFGQQYSDRIANPQDLILLKKEKVKDICIQKNDVDMDAIDNMVAEIENDEISVETLLEQYYRDQPDERKLSMLSVKCLGEAVKSFTQRDYTEAISEVITLQTKQYLTHLMSTNAQTPEDIKDQVSIYNGTIEDSKEMADIKKALETATPKKKVAETNISSGDDDEYVAPIVNVISPEKPTRGRGRGRGSRGGTRGSRGASKAKANNSKIENLNVSYETKPNTSLMGNWLNQASQRSSTRQSTAKNVKQKPIYIDDSDS